MAAVQYAATRHPGPVSQTHKEDTQDELDQELDWLIEKEEEEDTARKSPEPSSPPQSPTNSKEEEERQKKLRETDTQYPRSPSPRYSPRDQTKQTSQDKTESDEEDQSVSTENDGDMKNDEVTKKNQNTAADEEEENYDDDYEMSDDQKQAMMELQNMKLDLAYTVDEEPPEYDVTERVRQLNEELAKEPSPDDERARAIKFQTDPVSLVVPPPDYTESDEEANQEKQKNKEGGGASASDGQDQTMSKVQTQEKVVPENDQQDKDNEYNEDENLYDDDDDNSSIRSQESPKPVEVQETDTREAEDRNEDGNKGASKGGGNGGTDDHDDDQDAESDVASIASDATKQTPTQAKTRGSDTSSEEGDNEEKVLVERNGKFELLSAKDLTVEERIMYGVQTEEDKANTSRKETSSQAETVDTKSSSGSSDYLPTPPVHPRPATASYSSERRKRMSEKRAQSASQKPTYANRDYEDFNYTSPYALDPEKRKEYRKEHNDRKKQEQEEEERKRKDKERDQREAEEAFEAWRKKKRDESAKRRKEENERKKAENEQREREENDENGDCSDTSDQKKEQAMTFQDWNEIKRSEKQKQKQIQQAQRQEMQDGYSVRHRGECNKAFRDVALPAKTIPQKIYKEWLKKKNGDLRRQKMEEKQKYRVTRLLARRSRKSQQLAKAITHAQAFKYVDYYGYRY